MHACIVIVTIHQVIRVRLKEAMHAWVYNGAVRVCMRDTRAFVGVHATAYIYVELAILYYIDEITSFLILGITSSS